MGIISKTTKVKLWGKNMKPFLAFGYNGKKGDIIEVSIEHLNENSRALIDVQCDYCGRTKTITFSHYNKCNHSNNLYACTHCVGNKVAETNLERYGVPNTTMLQEVKDKMAITNMERYGVENIFQFKDCKEKIKQSMNEKYGVDRIMQSEYGKEKMRNTYIEKYGVLNPSQLQEVKNKIASTNVERYGGIAPAKSSEVREKMCQTLYSNSSQKVSKQQNYINTLYQGILNFPIKHYNVDIYLPEDNLTVEYDGGFHLGNVITGRETMEEFDRKEIIRNNIIKREGYKQMRIISSEDLLPSDSILLQMLFDTRNYFSFYPNHFWIEFNIDTSSLRNAEHPQGISYSFGELRRIKNSDMSIIAQQLNI